MVAVAQRSWNDHQTLMLDESLSCSPPINQPKKKTWGLNSMRRIMFWSLDVDGFLCFRFSACSEVCWPLESGDVYGVVFEKCGTPTPKVLGLEPLKWWLPSSGSPFPGSDLFRFHVKLQGFNLSCALLNSTASFDLRLIQNPWWTGPLLKLQPQSQRSKTRQKLTETKPFRLRWKMLV